MSAIIDDLEAFIPQIDANVDSYVLGIEFDEYWNLTETNQIASAMQGLTEKPIAFHETPDNYAFCDASPHCDFMLLQYAFTPTEQEVTTLTQQAISDLGPGKPLVAAEYNISNPESTSISLGDAGVAAGAIGFGNGGTAFDP